MSFWDKFKSSGDSFEYEIQNETVIDNVRAAGYEVLEADDLHLFLDIDSDEQYRHFVKSFDLLNNDFWGGTLSFSERWSIGGKPGRHVIVTLGEPMSILERIAWQACLGSDPKKEFNNLLGVHFGIPHHIVLFNEKGQQ